MAPGLCLCVCVCTHARVHTCAYVCACAHVCACVCTRMCVEMFVTLQQHHPLFFCQGNVYVSLVQYFDSWIFKEKFFIQKLWCHWLTATASGTTVATLRGF